MGIAKKLLFALCLLGLALEAARAQDAGGGELNWKMAVLKKNGAAYDSLPFNRPLSMTRRDAYQLYLVFEGAGRCYVIQEDDEGKLPLAYRKAVSPGDSLSFPGENRDFLAAELSGTSRLYVIVSARPKQNLERLLDWYGKEGAPETLERSILSEVLAIRRSLASPPEEPQTPALPSENDRAMNGQLWRFEGRDDWAVTVTVRN